MNQDLCLLFHCLSVDPTWTPRYHPELFVCGEQLEQFLTDLKRQGYIFRLPNEAQGTEGPVCSVTFDDGYYNVHHFLPIAEKLEIPFLIFLTSYNVQHQVPFIWDLWEAINHSVFEYGSVDYDDFYGRLTAGQKELIYDDNYRPFTKDELEELSASPWVKYGLHSHTHQPLVGIGMEDLKKDLETNRRFLDQFGNALTTDFSLPNGACEPKLIPELLAMFERVYTIEGGCYHTADRVINRISLVNTEMWGSLESQVDRSFSLRSRIRRRFPMLASCKRSADRVVRQFKRWVR